MSGNSYNNPIFEQDGIGIYFGPTFGQFYINDMTTKENLFKDDRISTLDEAKRKLNEAIKNRITPLRVIVKSWNPGGYEIKETNAVFYTKDWNEFKVHTLDDTIPNSMFRPRSWSYKIGELYLATDENRAKIEHIKMLEGRIEKLHTMISETWGAMKHLTEPEFRNLVGLPEAKK